MFTVDDVAVDSDVHFDGSDIRSHCDRVARIKWLFVDSERAPRRAEEVFLARDDRF